MLRRELIFLHSASGDGCNNRPRLLATQEDFYGPVCIGSTLRPCGTTGSTLLASLMDRSTAKAPNAISSISSCRRSSPATLSSGQSRQPQGPCGAPFAPWARGSLLAALQF